MQENNLNIFELLIEELEEFDGKKPWWLFNLLTWEFTDDEKKIARKYEKRIKKAASRCKGLEVADALDMMSVTDNFYLLGIEHKQKGLK